MATSRVARSVLINRHAPGRGKALVAAFSAAAAVGVVASPAAAGEDPSSIGDGDISARGAAVTVPVTFDCPEGWMGTVNLQIVEAIDKRFASGYGTVVEPCTGKPQRVEVYVQASTAEDARPFRPGPASAMGGVEAYDPQQQQGLCLIGPCLPAVLYALQPHEPLFTHEQVNATIYLDD